MPVSVSRAGAGDAVVLLHGLWFSSWTLGPLAGRLEAYGYRPLRYGWNTTGLSFEESAERLFAFVAGLDVPRLHIVAHSLGGILARALLHAHPEVPPGRVVTLGSPHRGSRTGRVAARSGPLRGLTGRAVAQLVAGEPERWGAPGRELGSIAGTRSFGLGRIFPGLERPNDGVVTEGETRLPGAALRSVPVTHTGMLFSPRVAGLVAGFLDSGVFPD